MDSKVASPILPVAHYWFLASTSPLPVQYSFHLCNFGKELCEDIKSHSQEGTCCIIESAGHWFKWQRWRGDGPQSVFGSSHLPDIFHRGGKHQLRKNYSRNKTLMWWHFLGAGKRWNFIEMKNDPQHYVPWSVLREFSESECVVFKLTLSVLGLTSLKKNLLFFYFL